MGAIALSMIASRVRPARAAVAGMAALMVAGLVGIALAADIPFGVSLLLGACYAPLVFLNFRLAVVLWIPLVFLEAIPSFNLGAKAAGLLLAAGWIAMLHAGGVATLVLRRHRWLLGALAGLLVWVTLSVGWAPEVGRAVGNVWQWWAVGVIFLIVATCARSDVALLLLVVGFVVGAVGAVLAGLMLGDLTADAVGAPHRFEGGAGDPNYLAAGLVSAIVLAAGLAAARNGAVWRWLMVVAIGLLALGVIMSESRGAAVATACTIVAALIFFKRRRLYVVAFVLLLSGFAALSLARTPGALDRFSEVDRAGPRGDLWTVAWRVAEDHPLGVGTNNYAAVARNYVREPGSLTNVGIIAEDPKVVHNLYLQLLAENGIPGLGLFMVVAVGCLHAAWLAGRRFEALNRRDLEALARAILVSQIAMLSAAVFLSSQVDKRLWVLLALGPAALEVSRRLSLARTTVSGEASPPTPGTAS